LGKKLAACIKHKEIKLVFDGDDFKIAYYSFKFPLNSNSTQKLLKEKDVEQTVKRYNSSPELLSGLLLEQYYSLAYWKDAFEEINYRRFFDILDLIGLRIEEPDVFEEIHQLIFNLLSNGKVEGLRVDHIDGLYYPEEYLQKLRIHAPYSYLIVEKILTDNENIPESWPIQGSTGYDFINYVNGLFVKQTSETATDEIYKRFTKNTKVFGELLFECKKLVIENYFLGDVKNLARLINQTLHKLSYSQFNHDKMPLTLAMLIACFPVYRTYLDPKNPTDKKGQFHLALNQAKQHMPELTKEIDAINFLLQQCPINKLALETLMRLQQFTGAVMAKGLEDTAFYRYFRFVSLNEVGGNPAKFGVSKNEFHQFNVLRQTRWPLTLNASSTHDTKRGEDTRARLNILSEMPKKLEKQIVRWAEINTKHKTLVNGNSAPDRNEEYLIYQTILGSYPFETSEMQEVPQRATAYIVKALREAKLHSSWLNPNKQYETAAQQFINQSLTYPNFLSSFLPFQKQVANYGFFNSLAQTLLKITCPGIPDFYQGSELWNLNMVDPDNRRPVDYQKREKILEEVSNMAPSNSKKLLQDYASGKAKFYVIFKALQVRRRLKSLFEKGTYVPLTVEGALKDHVFAFMRKLEGNFVVVVVPCFLVGMLDSSYSWGPDWKGTVIKLPANVPLVWKEELSGLRINSSDGLSVDKVLSSFPAALLIGGDST
jgi:(1->4)-alpha-D-glucan 1-alpha-D-glucosylmutase